MLDKDIIFSLQAYYCCFAHIVLYSHHVSLTHLLFAAKKKKNSQGLVIKPPTGTYGTFEGILELYYTSMTSSHPFEPIVCNNSNPQ